MPSRRKPNFYDERDDTSGSEGDGCQSGGGAAGRRGDSDDDDVGSSSPPPPPRNETLDPAEADSDRRKLQRSLARREQQREVPGEARANVVLDADPSARAQQWREQQQKKTEPGDGRNGRHGDVAEPQEDAGELSLQREDSVVNIDAAEVARINAEIQQRRSHRATHPTSADLLHRVFLLLTIPSAIIICALAVGLYAHKDVEAFTASRGVAGFCTACSVVLTAFLIYLHFTVYTNPTQQRYIIRILLMVPIYSIDSLIALTAFEYGTIIGLVRDTYEAYVIYMFFMLLMDYLHGEDVVLRRWREETSGEMKHLFPFTHILPPLQLNHFSLTVWKLCLVQYAVLNPLLTMITIPLYFTDSYEEGDFSPGNSYVYFAAIRFVSVTLAFTSLMYFFFATKEFLFEHKPLAKFMAIKAVVFLSFWQSVLIAVLHHFGAIPSHSDIWTSDRVATGLQNFIICIEMYIVCLAHRWIFTDDAYMPLTGRIGLRAWVVKHAFSVTDVVQGSKEVLLLSPGQLVSQRNGAANADARPSPNYSGAN